MGLDGMSGGSSRWQGLDREYFIDGSSQRNLIRKFCDCLVKSEQFPTPMGLFLLDYGAGNVQSLANTLERLGHSFKWISSQADFDDATVSFAISFLLVLSHHIFIRPGAVSHLSWRRRFSNRCRWPDRARVS
jgi:hypothetical protein